MWVDLCVVPRFALITLLTRLASLKICIRDNRAVSKAMTHAVGSVRDHHHKRARLHIQLIFAPIVGLVHISLLTFVHLLLLVSLCVGGILLLGGSDDVFRTPNHGIYHGFLLVLLIMVKPWLEFKFCILFLLLLLLMLLNLSILGSLDLLCCAVQLLKGWLLFDFAFIHPLWSDAYLWRCIFLSKSILFFVFSFFFPFFLYLLPVFLMVITLNKAIKGLLILRFLLICLGLLDIWFTTVAVAGVLGLFGTK